MFARNWSTLYRPNGTGHKLYIQNITCLACTPSTMQTSWKSASIPAICARFDSVVTVEIGSLIITAYTGSRQGGIHVVRNATVHINLWFSSVLRVLAISVADTLTSLSLSAFLVFFVGVFRCLR